MRLQRHRAGLYSKTSRRLLAEVHCLVWFRGDAPLNGEWGGALLAGSEEPWLTEIVYAGGPFRLILEDGRAGDVVLASDLKAAGERAVLEFRGGGWLS